MNRYKYILVDVDTQNDFLAPQGSLYVPGSIAIIPNLQKLFAWALESHVPILSTADSHVVDDPEFREFPPHCVVDTWGHQKIAATSLDDSCRNKVSDFLDPHKIEILFELCRQVVFEKQTYNVFDNPNIERALSILPTDAFIACGVATDYCVQAVGNKLLDLGKHVLLVADAVAAVDPARHQPILEALRVRGAEVVKTDELLRNLDRTPARTV